jgi:hypothetical protein
MAAGASRYRIVGMTVDVVFFALSVMNAPLSFSIVSTLACAAGAGSL